MYHFTTVKPLLRVLRGETVIPPPLWLMRQAGRYLPEYRSVRSRAKSFLDLCYSPELAAEVALQPVRRYGFDAAILFSDILVIPDALGQKVTFRSGDGPILSRLEDATDVAHLSLDRLATYLAPVYKTIHLLVEKISQYTTLIGFAGSPWTVATYMIEGGSSKDFFRTKLWMFNGSLFEQLMELLTEATIQHLLLQIDAGAEVIQLFDTWAGVLPEDEFNRWVLKPTTAITTAIHKVYPHIPVIAFPRGAGLYYEVFAAETGVQAVSIDSSVPLIWAAKYLQPMVAVQGNLDPVVLVTGGDLMSRKVHRIVSILGRGPFVFNLSHGITPETPPENITQLSVLVRTTGTGV